ncbi:MAG: YbhB/YbcL family Raf kinase inhibitor-like protein [Chthoniobacterales bacterium]|nr:YbhB/YbcL family Raf kinase inhibitor-like protein [Chthoniobacterales bacterium]
MKIGTTAFSATRPISARFTADGRNINPQLSISGVPSEAKSLALIVDDPDAPMSPWTHWMLWNIPAGTTHIAEDSVPDGAVAGCNDFGRTEYRGPSPPSGTHRYFFRLFALDTDLPLPPGAARPALEDALRNHVLAKCEIMGRYARG